MRTPGVSMSEGSTVSPTSWLNRRKLGRFDGEYLGVWQDVSAWLGHGENQLAVRMDNRFRRNVLPGRPDPDFLLYGGLAGGMRLHRLACLHLRTRSTWTRFELGAPGNGVDRLHVRFRVRNQELVHQEVQLRATLRAAGDAVGAIQSLPLEVPAGAETSAHVTLACGDLRRWSPEDPFLHTLELELLDKSGESVDRQLLRLGARSVEFGPDGCLLEGERLVLRGANRHESHPGFGNAMPRALHERDARLLVDSGANFVRLAHYPQSPEFLDACDRLGLFVYAELASWKSVRAGRWLGSARRQWRRMIVRDRNRPSVLVWGMGNESRSRRAYLELRDNAQILDPSRPVSYAENHLYRARREKTIGLADVWGVNYELDVLDEAAQASRTGAVLVTEWHEPLPAASR